MQLIMEVLAATVLAFSLFVGACALFGSAYRACKKAEKEQKETAKTEEEKRETEERG